MEKIESVIPSAAIWRTRSALSPASFTRSWSTSLVSPTMTAMRSGCVEARRARAASPTEV